VLKKQLRGRRLRLTDSQRRRLAAKGKPLGLRLLQSIATIVTPDTILSCATQIGARTHRETVRPPIERYLEDRIPGKSGEKSPLTLASAMCSTL
jgi:hypothetical protein